MFRGQRSSGYLQRCARANFSSEVDDIDPTELVDEEDQGETNLQKEFSFCHVTLLGRVGVKPKLVETSQTSFVTFVVGVNPRSAAPSKLFTKWHEIHVNEETLKKIVLNKINVGDRIYIRGNLSYVQDEQYNRKYRIYSDFIRLISHSQKYWKDLEEQKEFEE